MLGCRRKRTHDRLPLLAGRHGDRDRRRTTHDTVALARGACGGEPAHEGTLLAKRPDIETASPINVQLEALLT